MDVRCTRYVKLLGIISLCFAWQGEPRAAEQEENSRVSLELKITGLHNDKGRVAVALFDRAEGFPETEHARAGRVVRISGGTATVRFPRVEPGRYAVAVLHDENENDKMDFNFLGMPTEGFGFSRNPQVFFGPPSFDSAAISLRSRFSMARIVVRYF